MQFAFSSENRAALDVEIAFDGVDYANLDFLEFAGRDVLLHLSFQLRRQVVVYNQFLDGVWGPERPSPIKADPSRPLRVRVEFERGAATLRVDGKKVGTYPFAAPKGSTADAIEWVALNGGISRFHIEGAAHEAREGRGILYSEKPFLLDGWGFDPGTLEQKLSVRVAGTAHAVPLAVLPAPEHALEQNAPTDRIGVLALVPGWVWTHVDARRNDVALQLFANGRACGAPVVLTRDQIADTIEAVCRGGLSGNSLEFLTALEHARFAGLFYGLSEATRRTLREGAERYGVTRFFLPADESLPQVDAADAASEEDAFVGPLERDGGATPAAQTAQAPDEGESEGDGPEIDLFEATIRDVFARMALVPDDQMISLLRDRGLAPLPEDQQRELLLFSARGFCFADRFEELYALAAERNLADMPAGRIDGTTMSALPYHYMNARGADLTDAMTLLPGFPDYVEMCSISWTMQRVLRDRPGFLSELQRETMLKTLLAFARQHEPDYFSSLHSDKLVDVGVAAVETLATLSTEFQANVVFDLEFLFGQSPRFWDEIERLQGAGRIGSLPTSLSLAQRRFQAMRRALEDDRPADAHACVTGDSTDARRIRRELATAARTQGLPVRDALDMAQSQERHELMHSDALLRHLAFPGDTLEVTDLVEGTRRAVRQLSPEVPQSLYPARQEEAGRLARQLLERPVDDAQARTALLDAFFAECALLGSWRSEYLGQALPVSLLAGALTNHDAALAQEIPARAEALHAGLKEGELASVCAAPALRNALWSLRQAPGSGRSDAASAVFGLYADALPHLAPAFEARPDSLVPKTGIAAFFGILIVVYSCRANLDTRIARIRESWLADVTALGLPHIVVVGDGTGQREEDVVFLDVADDYVSLPLKSLAMAEWVLGNTGFAHLYKIDDDCSLNAAQAIGALGFAKYPYYGRRLYRDYGGMDRTWHHARGAQGNHALEIDKSPEPSEYADGGTGYTLNRQAMQDLVDTSHSAHGAWLKLGSFMEDKLVGDLLSLNGIGLASRDYYSCVLRKQHRNGQSTLFPWSNGFLPSAAAPSMVAHLDNTALLASTAQLRDRATLEPQRLWPSFRTLSLGSGALQLERMCPQDKLEAVNASEICVVACVRNERKMLPIFLEHYRRLGVGGFLIADNCSDDGTLEYLVEAPDVAVFSASTDYALSRYGVAWQHTLMSQLRMNRWSLVADSDEFMVLPDGVATLQDLVQLPEFDGADCARVFMIDMYPKGPLSAATLASGDPFAELTHCDRTPLKSLWNFGIYDNSEIWTSGLRHRLLQDSRMQLFTAQKHALIRYKPWMRFSDGLHDAAAVRCARRDLIFAHFKYHADFYDRARAETERGQHFNNAEEYRKYLALQAEGRNMIYDPATSVPWRQCDLVRKTLAAPRFGKSSAAAE